MAFKFNKDDYTEEELISVQPVHPRFACPHCGGRNWAKTSTFNTIPGDKLWPASTACNTCDKAVKWLIDPDRPVSMQTAKMHRPMGF